MTISLISTHSGLPGSLPITVYKGLSSDTKPTACDAGSEFWETDTGNKFNFNGSTWNQVSINGIAYTNQKGGIWDYGIWPANQGLTVNLSANASQTIVLPNIVGYHYGGLVITLGALDTLVVQARMADGTTVGTMTAIGPAATQVPLNAAQLVAANNGLYILNRFDCYDMLFVYTKSAGPLSIQGRLSAG